MRDLVNPLMSSLTIREREVISYRFGLRGEGIKSLDEAGEKFHITRERVRQIEARALIKMDHSLEDIEPLRHFADMSELRSLLQLCYTMTHRYDLLHSRIDKM